jgi:hypothetical protein
MSIRSTVSKTLRKEKMDAVSIRIRKETNLHSGVPDLGQT